MLHKRFPLDLTNIKDANNISNKNLKKTQQFIEKELIGSKFHAIEQKLFVLLRLLSKYSEIKNYANCN